MFTNWKWLPCGFGAGGISRMQQKLKGDRRDWVQQSVGIQKCRNLMGCNDNLICSSPSLYESRPVAMSPIRQYLFGK